MLINDVFDNFEQTDYSKKKKESISETSFLRAWAQYSNLANVFIYCNFSLILNPWKNHTSFTLEGMIQEGVATHKADAI